MLFVAVVVVVIVVGLGDQICAARSQSFHFDAFLLLCWLILLLAGDVIVVRAGSGVGGANSILSSLYKSLACLLASSLVAAAAHNLHERAPPVELVAAPVT